MQAMTYIWGHTILCHDQAPHSWHDRAENQQACTLHNLAIQTYNDVDLAKTCCICLLGDNNSALALPLNNPLSPL